jgi:trehalose-phosphatase
MTPLESQLERLAATPRLLVASDYDGVLAPIVADPARAEPVPESIAALRSLAAAERTDVAIVSGRARAAVAGFVGPDGANGRIRVIGCHGAEWPEGLVAAGTEVLELVDRLEDEARRIGRRPGIMVERKPVGVAVHYRQATAEDVEAVQRELLSGPGRWPGVRVRHGKKVVEVLAVDASKGDAVAALRRRTGATAVLFLGDDLTDEEVFITLGPADVGVKVGTGGTAAAFGVADPVAVAGLLDRLARRRRECVAAERPAAIERHSVLSDQRALAVVDPDGRVCWMCVPRIDSPAMFASLLGGPEAGMFAVGPANGGGEARQAYVGDSMVLRTSWPTMAVTDFLDCSGGRAYARGGRSDLVRVLEGRGVARVVFAPRLDFGRIPTRIEAHEAGLVVEGHVDPIVLHAPGIRWRVREEGPHQTAEAEVDLSEGTVSLELRYGSGNLAEPTAPASRRQAQTERFWSQWAATLSLPPLATEAVKRSALAIKALCYGPTGAIAAAGTTSLPEWPGGERNWDYRYCWPRDACVAAAALVRLGNTGVAMKLLDWLVGVVESIESPERLRPIYTVTGRELGPEGQIGELRGYMSSRPVRVGNAAAQQVQLDVFGPIVDLVRMLAERGAEGGAAVSPEHQRLVEAMVTAVARRWREPDHGIWEIRAQRRHHVHSRVMCWTAVDGAIRLTERMLGRRRPEWESLRREIAEDVLRNGWNGRVGAFTTAYGMDDLDAAALSVGLSGLLPPDDPRFVRTVEAVERQLRRGPSVRRYVMDDGLPGEEGGFLLCTGWLVEALVLTGRRGEARSLFESMLALAGPTGLLAEEHDGERGASLGNFPQAYSHAAVINAAVVLSGGGGAGAPGGTRAAAAH